MSLKNWGLRGSDHIGITVPDLEEAVEFFTQIVGCEFVFDGGAYGDDAQFMSQSLNVHPDSSLRYCFLRCANGSNFEIFEYNSPDQQSRIPKNSDVGGHHIALYVDDIEGAVRYLQENDIKVLGNVNYVDIGPASGAKWVYFLSPWGLQLELVSYPDGKAYERSADLVLWHPKFPER